MRARAGDVGEALGDLSARAALGRGEAHAVLLHQGEDGLLHALDVHAVDEFAQTRRRALHHGTDHRLGLLGRAGLGRDLQQTVALLGVGGHRGVGHFVHLLAKDLIDRALADAEDAQRVRHDLPAGELLQIGQRALGEHGAALLGRAGDHDHGLAVLLTGDHDHGLAVLLKGAAGGRAAVVVKDRAALRQQGLGVVVGREVPAVPDVVVQPLALGPVLHQGKAEGLGEDLLGQIVAGRPEAAGRDDDVGAALGDLDAGAQPFGVVAHDGVPAHVDPDPREHLGDIARVGVRHMAEQQLGPDREDLGIIASVRHLPTMILSTPASASSTRPSISIALSARSTSSSFGWVFGWRGVKTVQQSS